MPKQFKSQTESLDLSDQYYKIEDAYENNENEEYYPQEESIPPHY